jgi:NDP-sugar pyrophosphorylase family protein
MKKYELLKTDKIIHNNTTLYRIQRLSDGELGGYAEKEENLSHDGRAWIADQACVFDNAYVSGDAYIFGNAKIFGNASINHRAKVYGNAQVSGTAQVLYNSRVAGDSIIKDSHEVINISNGLKWDITMTPLYIIIGCMIKTHKEWQDVTVEEIERQDLKELFHPHYKLLFRTMKEIMFYHCPESFKEI